MKETDNAARAKQDAIKTQLMDLVLKESRQLAAMIRVLRTHGDDLDQRWVSIGTTHLQTGLMALRRAVTQDREF